MLWLGGNRGSGSSSWNCWQYGRQAMERVCSPVIQNTGSKHRFKIRIWLKLDCPLVSLQISRDHHEWLRVTMDHQGGSCEIWHFRKLLFGVAQAHMKAKDTNEAIETLDKTIGLAQAAGDMQDISQFDWNEGCCCETSRIRKHWVLWQETARLQQNLIDALLFRQRSQLFLQLVSQCHWQSFENIFQLGLQLPCFNMHTYYTIIQSFISVLPFFGFRGSRNPKAALRVAKEARTMAQKNSDKRAEAMPGSWPEGWDQTSVDSKFSIPSMILPTWPPGIPKENFPNPKEKNSLTPTVGEASLKGPIFQGVGEILTWKPSKLWVSVRWFHSEQVSMKTQSLRVF